MRQRLAPRSGTAFTLSAGQELRVIDPEGEQVADLVAFATDDPREGLSSGRSIDYNGTLFLTTGHVLFSSRSRPMLTIEEDTVGRHDFLFAPCSQPMFEIQYGCTEPHPNCLDNLTTRLARHGISPHAIPTPFNIFMHVDIDGATGLVQVKPPLSAAGDSIRFRAAMDLCIGLAACSAENTNAGTPGPIDYEILDP